MSLFGFLIGVCIGRVSVHAEHSSRLVRSDVALSFVLCVRYEPLCSGHLLDCFVNWPCEGEASYDTKLVSMVTVAQAFNSLINIFYTYIQDLFMFILMCR